MWNVLVCSERMDVDRSRTNGGGELRGNWVELANVGSPGRTAIKLMCVCVCV